MARAGRTTSDAGSETGGFSDPLTLAMRLDQWLWAVRLFKTRPLAVEAIRGGRVKVDGAAIKPAREVKPGETITVSMGSAQKIVRVIGAPTSRVGAKLVAQYYDDLTPPPDPAAEQVAQRERGAGRPTKRERRQLDAFEGLDAYLGD